MRTGTALRRAAALLAGLLAVVGLTACSGSDPKPGTLSPTPSASSSNASPSPSATTPEQQIEAAMETYVEAANQMFATGDVVEIRQLSTSACPCRKITRYVAGIAAKGQAFQGAEYSNVKIRVHDVTNSTGLAEVTADVPAYKIVDSSGEVVSKSSGGKLHTDYSLVKQEGDIWIIGNAVDLG
jgi:hypothetical protein